MEHIISRTTITKSCKGFFDKPLCWSYEEEVRILKCLKGISPDNGDTQSGHFEIVDAGGRDLYLLSLPKDSIKAVYFGLRSDTQAADDLSHEAKNLHRNLSVFKCNIDNSNLSVGFNPY